MKSANKLKQEFVTGATPNETHYHDLIELADIGRKAIGLPEGEGAAAPGKGLGWNSSDHKLSVKLKPGSSGLLVNHQGLAVEPGIGVQLAENKVTIAVKAEGALSTEAGLCVKTGNGVKIEGSSLKLHVDTDKGLSTDGGMLNVKFDSNTLKVTGNQQLSINYDGTYFTEQEGNLSLNEDHIERVKKALAKEIIKACGLMSVSTGGDVGEYPKDGRDQTALAAQLQPIVDAIKRVYVTDQVSSGRDISPSEKSLANAIGKLLARAYTAGAWAVAAALANKTGGTVMEASIRSYARERNDEPTAKGILGCVVEIAERLQNTLFPCVRLNVPQPLELVAQAESVQVQLEGLLDGLSLSCEATGTGAVHATVTGGTVELKGEREGNATVTVFWLPRSPAKMPRLLLTRFDVKVYGYQLLPLSKVTPFFRKGVQTIEGPDAAPRPDSAHELRRPYQIFLPDGYHGTGLFALKLIYEIPTQSGVRVETAKFKYINPVPVDSNGENLKVFEDSDRARRGGQGKDVVTHETVLKFSSPIPVPSNQDSPREYEVVLEVGKEKWGFVFAY
ncbi:hypothetical protein [Mycetohabitans sp. B46]|uniref:hypothetical protein n=1 Tax=Mycetohabitans sp. B46 TaxID=2772536 RepID=UPI00307EF4EC